MSSMDIAAWPANRDLKGSTLPNRLLKFAGVALAALALAACGDASNPGIGDGKKYDLKVTAEDIMEGAADAPVTLVEYASMTCSHCAAFHENTYPTLKEKYIDTGKVRMVFRPFPLDGVAAQASLLIQCVPDDRKVGLIETIFTKQNIWLFGTDNPLLGLTELAKAANVRPAQFAACVQDQNNRDWLTSHQTAASEVYEVNATPTFFINGYKVSGELSVAELDRIMDKLLPEGE